MELETFTEANKNALILLFPKEGNYEEYTPNNFSTLEDKDLKDYRKIVAIVHEDYAENPREEWDNAGTIFSLAPRVFASDKNAECLKVNVCGRDDNGRFYCDYEPLERNVKGIINTNMGRAYVLPIYMYSHSGERISATPFNDRWDSGRAGYIYMTEETAKKEQLIRKDGKVNWKAVKARLESEIETYDQYISGEVYGFRSHNIQDGIIEEDEDSCYGFFGDDFRTNGIFEYLNEKAIITNKEKHIKSLKKANLL